MKRFHTHNSSLVRAIHTAIHTGGRILPDIRIAAIVISIFSILTSCMARQEAVINANGSGSVNFRFEMESFFLNVLQDMSEFAAVEEVPEDGRIFDIEKIKQDFSEKPDINLESIDSPAPEILQGRLTFVDVEKVFKSETELTEAGVISFERENGTNVIRVRLDKESFRQIFSFLPISENPVFEMLNPEENEDMTEEEYLEMMEFILGEEGPPGILSSNIELNVRVRGQIISQTGGTIVGDGVVFRIPLIRVLLLDEPMEYSIAFK